MLACVRFDTVRTALVTFSDTAEVSFYLDTYQDKRDMLNALAFYQIGGRTNTQEAARVVDEQIFVSARYMYQQITL